MAYSTRDSVSAILTAVAKDVQILELYGLGMSFDIPLMPFPRLTDFTTDTYPMGHRIESIETVTSPLYPQLRRWHITNPMELYFYATVAAISKLAPSLIYLRISQIGQICIAGELSDAMGITGHFTHDSALVKTLPPSLQKVYAKPSSYWMGQVLVGDGGSYVVDVGHLEEANQLRDDCFVLLKAHKIAEDLVMGTTTKDWEAAINGEEGCWSIEDKLAHDESIEYEGWSEPELTDEDFDCLSSLVARMNSEASIVGFLCTAYLYRLAEHEIEQFKDDPSSSSVSTSRSPAPAPPRTPTRGTRPPPCSRRSSGGGTRRRRQRGEGPEAYQGTKGKGKGKGKGGDEWKVMDSVKYLLMAVTTRGGTAQTEVGTVEPILQVDAIRYRYTFRNQLTKELPRSVLPLLVRLPGSDN
ncbi:hypothetical protein FIBSPDRAFT_984632 [Athelia psychrophila]|uniref:Exportin-2 central domain-containing protein n=1 Tax=Athelia psychrophila TaxID=1759441 RepID=A0A166BI68_9AGAM|nr:hypothetical protein FIBSPDRAFT_984632 [Fibularhizoctonia sp. CBS 109695]